MKLYYTIHSIGIVLMAGELDTAHLVRYTSLLHCIFISCCEYINLFIIQTPLEAQYLANQAQLYYNSGNSERYALLRQFNHEPDTFDHRKLVEQLSNSSIETASAS